MEYHSKRTDIVLRYTTLLETYPVLAAITDWARARGGAVYLVGGAVRDLVRGVAIGDLDVEVHGVTISELREQLSQWGDVLLCGASFGVLRINHIPIDWSIPRIDSVGRKPNVDMVPNLAIEDALRRRDVTMNAIALCLHDGMCIDPFGGIEDIRLRRLRAVDAQKFSEDPLRFFRVMQFIGRFAYQPDATLNDICRYIDLTDVSRERIAAEFDKLMLKSQQPSLGFRWLAQCGRLREIVPELALLEGLLQSHDWHPEGDVFEHAMQAVDAAVENSAQLSEHEQRILRWAALCHDLGKATTTQYDATGRLRSIGHAEAGVAPTYTMLRRVILRKDLHDAVARLVRYHMEPGQFVTNRASSLAYKRLAQNLAPVANLRMLFLLADADKRARNPDRGRPLSQAVTDLLPFKQRALELGVLEAPELPLITGADVCAQGFAPGPNIGALVRRAYDLQIRHERISKEALWILLEQDELWRRLR